MTSRRTPHALWRYSLRVYRDSGVQAACLALQDGCGADVNLLLFCGWLAGSGRTLDRRRARQATACVARWQSEVIVPLRAARRAHKRLAPGTAPARDAASELHRRLLGIELEFEWVEQCLLAELAARWPPPALARPAGAAVATNLARYAERLGRPVDAALLARLADALVALG